MNRSAAPVAGLSSLIRDVGLPGLFTVIGVVLLIAMVAILLPSLRPPTLDEIERDIWQDWARTATDPQGLTLIEQILEKRRGACQQLIGGTGRLIETSGDRFIVRTAVHSIKVIDREGQVFAEWQSPSIDNESPDFKNLTIPLTDPQLGLVGNLVVHYRFYSTGLQTLPNVRRLQGLYRTASILVVLLTALLLALMLANLARIRERAGRLRSQQLTINLAHQMCHELRNGLWAFTLEGKNLGNHFDRLDRFFTHFEPALRAALSRQGLDAGKQDRVLQFAFDQWADLQADPQIDLKPSNEMAKDSERQIRSFANYLNLTIEELDRYLLGLQEENVPELLRVSDVWHEVRQLIELRLRSAGVQIVGPNQVSSDWVFVDRRSLVHTLINLTKNAIEALRNSTPPRQLTITIDASDSQVMVSMHNLGQTIPKDKLDRLFANGFSTKDGTGRGTGLQVIGESVRRMKGTISADSNESAGTTFVMTLQRVNPTPDTSNTTPAA